MNQVELVAKQKPQHETSSTINLNWLPSKNYNIQPPCESILTGCHTKSTTCSLVVNLVKLVVKQKPQHAAYLWVNLNLLPNKNHKCSLLVSQFKLVAKKKNHKMQPPGEIIQTSCQAKITTCSHLVSKIKLVAKKNPQMEPSCESVWIGCQAKTTACSSVRN